MAVAVMSGEPSQRTRCGGRTVWCRVGFKGMVTTTVVALKALVALAPAVVGVLWPPVPQGGDHRLYGHCVEENDAFANSTDQDHGNMTWPTPTAVPELS